MPSADRQIGKPARLRPLTVRDESQEEMMPTVDNNPLGTFLKARRASLSPSSAGSGTRRRTPGLRREEVAERAHISAKWYTFLEQGRGGPPSAEVLDRLSRALELTRAEREHLFNLVRSRQEPTADNLTGSVTPALRRLLDSMEFIPAFLKTPTWDIVAWNRAAAVALTDYGTLAPERRNLLRLLFADPDAKQTMSDWEGHARSIVAAFRLETARRAPSQAATALIDELTEVSRDFAALWSENHVGIDGEGLKTVWHLQAGPLNFSYTGFSVDGRPELGLVVFSPATSADAAKVKQLVNRHGRR